MALLATPALAEEQWATKAWPERKCEGRLRRCKKKDFTCHRGVIICLIDAGHARFAVRLSKRLAAKRPARPEYQRLLARAYLAADNPYWAVRILVPLVQKHPGDCLTRSMLAWTYVQEAHLDLAQEALQDRRCPREPADQARWALLRAFIEELRGNRWAARSQLAEAEAAGAMYPEDQPLWEYLLGKAWPDRRDPIQLYVDVGLGFTSDARRGVPLPSVPRGSSTGLFTGALSGRIVGPSAWPVRPLLEAGIATELNENFGDVDVSHVNRLFTTFRPGISAELGAVTALLGYRNSLLFVWAPSPITGAKPVVVFETHRGELELSLPYGITALAGVGRQYVFQVSRTGWMLDGGGGWSIDFANGHSLALAASGRFFPTDLPLYTQYGGTLAGNWGFPIHGRFTGQFRLGESFDYYPNSPSTGGTYSLFEAALQIWADIWGDAQAGVGYDLGLARGSTDALPEFTAHRLMAKMRWNLSWDPWGPKAMRPTGHVGNDYGLKQGTDFGRDVRIQDLLRADSIPQQSR